jgi:hypothetical protein
MTTVAFSGRPTRAKARQAGARACLAEVARALLFGLLFALVVPVITFVVTLGFQRFDTGCGDSDGCTMGLVSATILSIAPGAILGFLIARAGLLGFGRRPRVNIACILPPVRAVWPAVA